MGKEKPIMRCPFCGHDLNLQERLSYVEEEYFLSCFNCDAIGAIYRKKVK